MGTYTIFASGPAVDGNYAVSYTNGKLMITPATLSFTALPATMTYGATSLPTLTYSVSGLVNGDTASAVVATPPTLTTAAKAANPSQPGSGSHVSGSPYVIHIGRAVLSTNSQGVANYTVTYAAGNLTVTPAPLTITADNKYMLAGRRCRP